MPEQRIKKYVEVIADFQPDGTLIPQTVIWDTGLRFDITNISEVMPRKYSKTGGVGVRYTCIIELGENATICRPSNWKKSTRRLALMPSHSQARNTSTRMCWQPTKKILRRIKCWR